MENSVRHLIYDKLADASLGLYFALRKRLDAVAKEAGLSYQQAQVLAFLKDKSLVTMTALAKEFDLTQAGMTGLIDRLVEKRLVVREYDPKDRRVVLITISENGRAKSNIYQKKLAAVFKKIACGLSSEERKTFIILSKKLKF
ncbi:MAG: MarR family transcriptional regulator [Candidatus Omnitrophica bacterium]|nr:MarR family transcriptional regulator [Candidatus Omnitrophota bacterium]